MTGTGAFAERPEFPAKLCPWGTATRAASRPWSKKRLAALAAGRAHATSHTWRDWTAPRAPHRSFEQGSKLSVSPYSRRRVATTTTTCDALAGRHLPAALSRASALILRHEPSGVCISFCALEALRAWALLQHAPVPHLSARAAPEWDYSFTTAYAGATTPEFGCGARNRQGRALAARTPPVSSRTSAARLRRPLCKCVNTYGCLKLPAAAVADPAAAAAVAALPPPRRGGGHEVRPRSSDGGEAEAYVTSCRCGVVDQDPHSLSTLTAVLA